MADSVLSGAAPPQLPPLPVGRGGGLFSGESSSESSCRVDTSLASPAPAPPFLRHSSSPAGMLSRLLAHPHGMAARMSPAEAAQASRRLSSQWSFSKQGSSGGLPKISETGVIIPDDIGESIVTGCNSSGEGGGQSFFSVSSWDDPALLLYPPAGKRPRENSGGSVEPPQFVMPPHPSLEMAGVEEYIQMQQDSGY